MDRQPLKFSLKTKKEQAVPSPLFKLNVGLLSLVRLEVNTGLQPIHFKGLVDAALCIQI